MITSFLKNDEYCTLCEHETPVLVITDGQETFEECLGCQSREINQEIEKEVSHE